MVWSIRNVKTNVVETVQCLTVGFDSYKHTRSVIMFLQYDVKMDYTTPSTSFTQQIYKTSVYDHIYSVGFFTIVVSRISLQEIFLKKLYQLFEVALSNRCKYIISNMHSPVSQLSRSTPVITYDLKLCRCVLVTWYIALLSSSQLWRQHYTSSFKLDSYLWCMFLNIPFVSCRS